ncbi:MAG: enoyl-CoA hydratase-related protein [Planctomycetota bacterium]
MNESALVLLEHEDGLARLRLNRPEVRNALSLPALKCLRGLLGRVASDQGIRAVEITGSGEKAFCAGADLKERRSLSESQVREYMREIRIVMDAVAALPQPTVAVLNGSAFGGGCELALACDLRVMQAGDRIGLTETSLGIIPGAGGCVRLPRLVGAARAKDMILLARRLDAEEARDMGLIQFLAPAGEVRRVGREVLEVLMRNAPLALRAAKAAIDGGLERPLEEALQHEFDCYLRTLPTRDRLEALAAFAEKRPPRFEGR